MVDLVDILIKWTPMQRAVRPIVPSIFEDEENGDLVHNLEDRGERDASCEAEELSHWVEEPISIVSMLFRRTRI